MLPGSGTFAQSWTFDATGNWAQFQQGQGGVWDFSQRRTHDAANEITGFGAFQGDAGWAQPAYDRNGNMLSVPCPLSPTTSFTCTYDAWNRLVQIFDAATEQTVVEYAYDGRGYRITTQLPPPSASAPEELRHYYCNSQWQVLEERVGVSSPAPNPEPPTPAAQHVWGGRYVDDLVLRDRGTERLFFIQDPNWNVTAFAARPAGPSSVTNTRPTASRRSSRAALPVSANPPTTSRRSTAATAGNPARARTSSATASSGPTSGAGTAGIRLGTGGAT